MENLTTEMKSKIASLDKAYNEWKEAAQSISIMAVFNQQKDLMDVMHQNVSQKHEEMGKWLQSLDSHVGRTTKPIAPVPMVPAPPKEVKEPASNNGRVAANLPGMNGVASAKPAAELNGFPEVPQQRYVPPAMQDRSQKNTLPMDWRTVTGKSNSNSNFGAIGTPKRTTQQPEDTRSNHSNNSFASDQEEGALQPNKTFLTNLARESDSKTIAASFKKYGSVVDVKIFRFPSGESRGFGAVEFVNAEAASKAIKAGTHRIDNRDVEAIPFRHRDSAPATRGTKRFQIFLGGVPSFLSLEEVKFAVGRQVKIRDIRLNSERGYAYLDVESEEEVKKLLNAGHIKIGEKLVECKENKRQ